jgi:hypothetical protein
LQSYHDIFDDTILPEMKGDAFKINLKPDVQPYAQAKARKIPIPYMDQLKKQLDEMERLDVISVHEEPSTWCHPIVIAPKKDSDELRICIDFTHLNKFIQHEFHPSIPPYSPLCFEETCSHLPRPMLHAWSHTEAFKVPDSCH